MCWFPDRFDWPGWKDKAADPEDRKKRESDRKETKGSWQHDTPNNLLLILIHAGHQFLSPCMTGDACWKWPRCHRWLRGRCGLPGTQPAGKQGSSYPSHSAQTGWVCGVWVADWCSVASWAWEWGLRIPSCPHTSPSNLNMVRNSENGLWCHKRRSWWLSTNYPAQIRMGDKLWYLILRTC